MTQQIHCPFRPKQSPSFLSCEALWAVKGNCARYKNRCIIISDGDPQQAPVDPDAGVDGESLPDVQRVDNATAAAGSLD